MKPPEFILNISSLSQLRKPDPTILYDMLIIGGGPAAMSATIYAARKMVNLIVLSIDFGGLIKESSEIENYLGFQSINSLDLAARFEEHVKGFDIPASLGIAVKKVEKKENIFIAMMEDRTIYSGRTVIFATGGRHRSLSVPGAKELVGKGVSYCATCDAPLFQNKKVIIIGGGNSAFSTAIDLIRVKADIVLVNFSEGWQADAILQQRVKDYDRIKYLDSHEVISIGGENKVENVILRNRKTGKEVIIDANGVFIEIGLVPNSSAVADLVKLNEIGEVITDCLCRTSVEGFFSAGDVTSIPHKQIIISAGEGAKAALSAYEYLLHLV